MNSNNSKKNVRIIQHPIEHCPKPTQILSKSLIEASRLIYSNQILQKKPIHLPKLNKTCNSNTMFRSPQVALAVRPIFRDLSKSIAKLPALLKPKILKHTQNDTSSDSEEVVSFKEISEATCRSLIETYIFVACNVIVIECRDEMISASLRLFASSIKDIYIIETLEAMLPMMVSDVINGISNRDYIEIQTDIVNTLIAQETLKVSAASLNKHLIKLISFNIIHLLPVTEIVEESIHEIKHFIYSVCSSIFNDCIDKVLNEEWLEILAEDEWCYAKLNSNFLSFPWKMQKEIIRNSRKEFEEKIVEQIYFDMLNEYIAGKWLILIVKSCICGDNLFDFDVSLIMPKSATNSRRRISAYIESSQF